MTAHHPLTQAQWLNPPEESEITSDAVHMVTTPNTDFWQRTFYGFQNTNAPAALVEVDTNVTFSVRVETQYRRRYDQAGILVWIDVQNWFKASVEYESQAGGRLGSVVTNHGQSDWATRDLGAVSDVWWRLSRRGPDFLLEAKTLDHWEQLRVFHLAALGPTDPAWEALAPDEIPASPVRLGVYACSPEDSSFSARFDHISLLPSAWTPHV